MQTTGIRAAAVAIALWTAAVSVTSSAVAQDDLPLPMPDGRMLGHLQYPEANRADLIAAPAGFAIGAACLLRPAAAADLARLLAAAAATPGVGRSLRGVSCFRSVARQRAVFCRASPRARCPDPVRRARFVGPPGYSEHATGYALDFGARPSPGCSDVDACLSRLPAGRWLLAHAPEHGFELSFPSGNQQSVTWEPWHWRWVGVAPDAPGAAAARIVFARARSLYPASPAVIDAPAAAIVTVTTPPPVAFLPLEPVPQLPPPPRKRRRGLF